MAEAWMRLLYGEEFHAESAGLEPGVLNPLVVEAMAEVGLDISSNVPQSVFELLEAERKFTWVITVCDGEAAEQCPIFPGPAQRKAWSFEDPSSFTGTDEERLAKTRVVRDTIKAEIEAWYVELSAQKAQNA